MLRKTPAPKSRLRLFAFFFLVLALVLLALAWLFSRSGDEPQNENEAPVTNEAPATNASPSANRAVNTNSSTATNQTNASSNTNTETPSQGEVPEEISRVSTNDRVVVFTFDAGSGNTSVSDILDALEAQQVTGTFFLTGRWAEQFPEDVRAIADAGHEIYNHTYSHPHLPDMLTADIQSELERTNTLIKNLTGKSTKPYFRPPYGDRNDHVLEAAWAAGYQSIFWTVDALDWKESEGVTAAQVRERILTSLEPGAIYLMHVGDTITGSILDGLIEEVRASGYEIRPLGQALRE